MRIGQVLDGLGDDVAYLATSRYDRFSISSDPKHTLRQGDSVSILTPGSVHEPTHTNLHRRVFLLSILLLLCWTGWVYVDRQPVLRANALIL